MLETVDHLNRTLTLPGHPQRIISLVPSQTELLFDLGLTDEVIGITKFCVHPKEWFETKTRIGGTKNLNLDKIRSLNPDLIIANKEENTEDQIQILMKEFPVWVSDITNLENALSMIKEISIITGKQNKGEEIIRQIKTNFNSLNKDSVAKISCAYLIWNEPFLSIGGDTFISEMLNLAGYINVFQERKRYPETTIDELRNYEPKIIFLSSEPYPFKEKNRMEFQSIFPEIPVELVDGEMFSWYGSRLLKAPSYFSELRVKIDSAL